MSAARRGSQHDEKRYGFVRRALVRLAMLLTLGVVFFLALSSALLLRSVALRARDSVR